MMSGGPRGCEARALDALDGYKGETGWFFLVCSSGSRDSQVTRKKSHKKNKIVAGDSYEKNALFCICKKTLTYNKIGAH